jgi:hypothetical protein
MKVRLSIAAGALAVSGLASALGPVAALAATPAATADGTAASATTTATTCTGHWPRAVRGVPTAWHSGARGGDYIWHDANGWHVRVTHATSSKVVFSGTIVSSEPLAEAPVKLEGRDFVALSADRKTITYRLYNYGKVDGFNFKTACAHSLKFTGFRSGVKLPVSRIWVGHDNKHPLQNPFIVTRVS